MRSAGNGATPPASTFTSRVVAINGDDRRRTDRRGGDAVDELRIQSQMTEAAVVAGEIVIAKCQTAETAFAPTGQNRIFNRQPGAAAQLPRRWRVIGLRSRQWLQTVGSLSPRLPESTAIGQAIQPTFSIESRLLNGLFNLGASHATRRTECAVSQALGHHQPRRRPRLMRPTPLDPGQTLAIRAECRRGIKIRAFSQQMSRAVSQINRHQPMLIVLFFDRQHLAVGKMQIAITALARRQCFRLAIERSGDTTADPPH